MNKNKKYVCYLTGAPATGKSTLCRELGRRCEGVKIFSYSAELRDYINQRRGLTSLSEDSIREKSALVVTKEDVQEVDQRLIDVVERYRNTHHILIDSHPVTKEAFGFRVTAFSAYQLEKLSPDKIFCLYAPAETISQRITVEPKGRPCPSHNEIQIHIQTQISVATQYSILLGKPCYLLDSSKDLNELVEQFFKLSGILSS